MVAYFARHPGSLRTSNENNYNVSEYVKLEEIKFILQIPLINVIQGLTSWLF